MEFPSAPRAFQHCLQAGAYRSAPATNGEQVHTTDSCDTSPNYEERVEVTFRTVDLTYDPGIREPLACVYLTARAIFTTRRLSFLSRQIDEESEAY